MRGAYGVFFLWAFAVIFVWLFIGPLVREVVVNGLNKVHATATARYVNSA